MAAYRVKATTRPHVQPLTLPERLEVSWEQYMKDLGDGSFRGFRHLTEKSAFILAPPSVCLSAFNLLFVEPDSRVRSSVCPLMKNGVPLPF